MSVNLSATPARAISDPDWHIGVPGTAWSPAIAAAVFLAHLAVVAWGPYGPHRDALLYYAMGEHLRLFAMDFPPFIALVARATRALGDSELVTHLPIAGAHALIIGLAASFARRAGGGRGAQVLTALAVATGPVFMRAGSLFQPVVFDQLWWTTSLWLLARLGSGPGIRRVTGDDGGSRTLTGTTSPFPRRWLWLGVFLGLGLLTKFTILVLCAGILVAVLATPLRRHLLTPWPWLAAALALAIGSPSIVGQATLGWPLFGQLDDLAATQLARVTPGSFALEQLLMVGPVVLLAAGVALATLVRGRDVGRRAVAWAAVASFALMLLAGGKAYYIVPIWPALLGIGLGVTDAWLRRRRPDGRSSVARRARRMGDAVVRGTLWVAVVGYGLVALPLGLPFLPPEPMSRYAAALSVTGAVTTNVGERLELPQDYADMLGWDELAAATEAAWRALPAADRSRAVILATNYGRAGAIDYFASDQLPDVISPVGSYWFWGPGERPGEVVVVVGAEVEELAGAGFRSAVEVDRVRRPWGVPEERDVPIVVARDPVRTLQEVWPELRGMN